jgi:hypothetical protein
MLTDGMVIETVWQLREGIDREFAGEFDRM